MMGTKTSAVRGRSWTADDLPDMSGRTVVVTGASSGIGAATAREFARVGAKVVLAVRDPAKGARIARTMPADVEVRPLELDNLASVRAFAGAWSGDLDILINNAGILMVPEGRTADGFERHIGTNHLGHFALTILLLSHITDRVVTVASDAHARGRLDLDDLNWRRRPYRADQAYSDSKLANMLFILELQRQLTESGSAVRAIAVHPGMVRTNLFGHASGIPAMAMAMAGRLVMQEPRDGARSTLFAATGEIPGGSFVQPSGFGHLRGSPMVGEAAAPAFDVALARRLWARSAELTSIEPGRLS
jgi:NAD(P)-dependent dehydrogenase (short-subunit alcohol dehydrogenase family)